MTRSTILIAVALVLIAAGTYAQGETAAKAELQVCTSIVDRMPQGADTTFGSTVEKLYCWSKITGADGTTVTHVWLHEGKEVRRVDLPVKSVSWRTWSEKNLHDMMGNWEVQVVDGSGAILGSVKFTVGK